MEKRNIDQMVKGWFIGNFEPTLLKTNDMEGEERFKSAVLRKISNFAPGG